MFLAAMLKLSAVLLTTTALNALSNSVSADSVCEGDIRVNTPSELAAFSRCTELTGSLTLYNTTLIDLQPLSQLAVIRGDVYLYSNDELTSLNGLEHLNTVNGHFDLLNNPALNTLQHLASLSFIGGRVTLWDNPLLTTLDGLEHLTELKQDVDILFNKNLTTLHGLHALQKIGGHLKIQGNDQLRDLNALNSLTEVGSSLDVTFNTRIRGLRGLENVKRVGGTVSIQHVNTDVNDADNCLPAYLRSRVGDFSQLALREQIATCAERKREVKDNTAVKTASSTSESEVVKSAVEAVKQAAASTVASPKHVKSSAPRRNAEL